MHVAALEGENQALHSRVEEIEQQLASTQQSMHAAGVQHDSTLKDLTIALSGAATVDVVQEFAQNQQTAVQEVRGS